MKWITGATYFGFVGAVLAYQLYCAFEAAKQEQMYWMFFSLICFWGWSFVISAAYVAFIWLLAPWDDQS